MEVSPFALFAEESSRKYAQGFTSCEINIVVVSGYTLTKRLSMLRLVSSKRELLETWRS